MEQNNPVDIAIIGGGPAGGTASIYGVYDGNTVVVFEERTLCWLPENHINLLERMEGFPTLVNRVNGAEFVAKFRDSLNQMNVIPNEQEKVMSINKTDKFFQVETTNRHYDARAVILATGTTPKTLGLTGETEFAQRNVHYFAFGLGETYRGKRVAVLGSRNSGSTAAIYLAKAGAKVTIFELKDTLQAKPKHTDRYAPLGIKTITGARVITLNGEKRLTSINYVKDNLELEFACDGLFVYIGIDAKNSLAKSLGAECDEQGYVLVNKRQETNVPGVLAAGDLTGGLKHAVAASGEGATAAYFTNAYLMSLPDSG